MQSLLHSLAVALSQFRSVTFASLPRKVAHEYTEIKRIQQYYNGQQLRQSKERNTIDSVKAIDEKFR